MSEESNAVKRIRTTMIGAIDSVERNFSEEIKNSPDFKNKFSIVRKEILDLGNKQIRNLKDEE